MTRECGYYEDSVEYRKCVDKAGARLAHVKPAKELPGNAEYRAAKQMFLEASENLAWATRCGYVTEADFNSIDLARQQYLFVPYGGFNGFDTDIADEHTAALKRGVARARQSCAFWSEHPSELVELRREAQFSYAVR